ncbi:MAG TPA: DUF998 domain-containing protein [Nitrososphaerales archaeon]|nr:DUF998 domain-containing protein [Nitrososphaerales archaeon]
MKTASEKRTREGRASDSHAGELAKIRRRYSVALVGIVLYIVLDAVAQLLPPHYSPISQAESDLAVGKFGYIMTVNFLNRGLLSLEFLLAFMGTIRLNDGRARNYRGGLLLLGTWSMGAFLLAVFPTDVPPTPVSWHGAIHLIVAVIAFLGGAFGALMMSLRMESDRSLRGVRQIALPVSVVVVVLCILDLLGGSIAHHAAANYGGLIERLFLGSVLLWIAVVSAFMLRKGQLPPQSSGIPLASASKASSYWR